MSFVPTTVLRAKLRPPAAGVRLLDRPRLNALLDEAATAPLTLLVSPAGTGKTSLLAGWAAASAGSRDFAWLSLDETDRDVAQLWTGVGAALRSDAFVADTAMEAVDALLDVLQDAVRGPTVLVVDDAHVLDGAPQVASSLALFVSHLPDWLRVVIASRTTPSLPLPRLRARGQLREIGYADLRFTSDESVDLLHGLAPDLPADRVDALARRSQGWAATLQLAALAARTASVDVDHGDDLLNEYLWDEVLAAEDPDVLDVLLATAVVERIDADLGRQLSGHPDAPALLETARSRGLLVSRLETDTYRVHDLVRAALLRELERRRPGWSQEQHAAAAAWYQGHGDVPLAIEHLLAAGRSRDVIRLLAESCGPLYDAGREETVRRAIARVPLLVAADDADALVELAWCHLVVDRHRFRELAAELDRLEDPPPHLVPRILLIRGIALLSGGDWTAAARLAEQAVEVWDTPWWADPLGRFAWNIIGRGIALTERWDDASAEVRRTLQSLSLDPERRAAFEPSRAIGLALSGRPHDVLRIAAEVRAATAMPRMSIVRSELEIAEALARRELGAQELATGALLEVVESPLGLASYGHLLAWLALAETRMEEGDLDRAEAMFGEASALVAGEQPGVETRWLLARTGVRLALAADHREDAAHWAGQVHDGFWGPVSRFRVTADPDLLDAARPRCPRHAVVLDLLRFHAGGDARHLDAAIAVAVPLGLVQTVASEGPAVAAAVEDRARQLPRPWLVALRAAATPRHRTTALDGGEPLTDRERDVLRFLPTSLTLREIADQLFISQNTVKTHVKAIYRKLGCTTRAEVTDRLRTESRAARAPGNG